MGGAQECVANKEKREATFMKSPPEAAKFCFSIEAMIPVR